MNGFFAAPPLGWADARVRVDGEWTRPMAIMDLRWLQDQVLAGLMKMPGTPALAKMWGWGRKRVRILLSLEVEWSDPKKLAAWRELRGPPKGQSRASEGPGEGQVDQDSKPDTDDEGPGEGQAGARQGPAEGYAREPLVPQPQPPPPSTRKRLTSPKHPAFDRVLAYWNDKIVPAMANRGVQLGSHPRLDPAKGLGSCVNSWLHSHDDDDGSSLRRVIRWFAASDHPRAQHLRDGGHSLQTLVRPVHADEYTGFANAYATTSQRKQRSDGRFSIKAHPYYEMVRSMKQSNGDNSPVTSADISDAVANWGEPKDGDE